MTSPHINRFDVAAWVFHYWWVAVAAAVLLDLWLLRSIAHSL